MKPQILSAGDQYNMPLASSGTFHPSRDEEFATESTEDTETHGGRT
jgi:hypothetical protein